MDRIQEPMEKLSQLNNAILEKEGAKEVLKAYKATMTKLEEFEARQVTLLGRDVGEWVSFI